MVCRCGKIVTIAQVCRTLLIFSGVVQAWPYPRFVFPEAEVFSWPSDLSFAESRDVFGQGSYGPLKADVKTSQGFKQVVESATKTPKPSRHKHDNIKPNKVVPAAVNKPAKGHETISGVHINAKSGNLTTDIVFPKEDAEMIDLTQRQRPTPQPSELFTVKPCTQDVLCDDLYGSPSADYPGEAVVRSVQANFEAVKEFFTAEEDVSVSLTYAALQGKARHPGTKSDTDKPFSKLQEADLNPKSIVPNPPSPDERPLCTAESITRYPRKAKTANDNWLLVVNHENYTQGVKIEKCQEENSECYMGENLAPLGYRSICRQKYAYRKLLAITPDGRTIAETFTIPSCCSCHLKRDPSLASRSKSPTTPPPAREELTIRTDDVTNINANATQY